MMDPFQNTYMWMGIIAVILFIKKIFELEGKKKYYGDKKKLAKTLGLKKHYQHYLIAILLLSIIIRVSTINLISITSDEGFHIYSSWKIYEGLKPYTDFMFTQQPLNLYQTALLFKILGVGIVQAKIIPIILSISTVGLSYIVAKRFFSIEHAIASTALIGLSHFVVKFSNTANTYSEMVFLHLMAIYLFLSGYEKKDIRLLVIAGILIGVSALYKMLGLLPLGAILIFLASKNFHKLFKEGLSVLAGVLIILGTATYLLYSTEYLYQVYIHHSQYLNDGFLCKAYGILKVLAVDPLFMLPGLTGVYLTLKKRKRSYAEDFLLIYLGVVVASILVVKYLCGFSHPYLYFTLAIPAFSIIAGSCFTRLNESFIPVLASLILVSCISFYIYFVAETYNYTVISSITEYIQENTGPDDQIMGDSPLAGTIGFKAGRDIPPVYMEFFSLHVRASNHSIADYKENTGKVKYVITYPFPSQYPVFFEFLSQNAVIEKKYGTLKPIYVLRIKGSSD